MLSVLNAEGGECGWLVVDGIEWNRRNPNNIRRLTDLSALRIQSAHARHPSQVSMLRRCILSIS